MTNNVLMVALDALDDGLLERLVAAGRLPNLGRFMADADKVSVRSDGDTLHGTLWPTFACGTGPGHHGRYFWNQWSSKEMRHLRNDREELAFDPFWTALIPEGRTATIVDLPYVPAVRSPGFRTNTGWGLHDDVEPFSYPADFAAQVHRIGGKSPLSFDTVEPHDAKAKLKMVADLTRSAHARMAILNSLVGQCPTALTVIAISETHKASHYLSARETIAPGMNNEDGMASILKEVDDAWPELLEAAGPDCRVLLFALHGTQEQVDFGHFGTQLLALLAGERPQDETSNRDIVRRIRDLLPGLVHRAIWTLLPGSMRSARTGNLALASTDLGKDKVFRVMHDGHTAFRLNLVGREEPGLISAEDGDALLTKLEALAKEFSADDGQRAFSRLMRPQQEHPGPRSHELPDALLLSNLKVPGTNAIRGDTLTLESKVKEARNGVHTGRGFCYLARSADHTVARTAMDVRDFAPTILELLDTKPTTELDGTSILG